MLHIETPNTDKRCDYLVLEELTNYECGERILDLVQKLFRRGRVMWCDVITPGDAVFVQGRGCSICA